MQKREGGLPEQVGTSCAEQVPPTIPVVPATQQCCVEFRCLAIFKTKFVIAKHATKRHARTRGGVACLSKVVLAVLSMCPPPCLLSLPPIHVTFNLGA
jgi:hypothetical protein